jgi:hypothetical protein
MNIKKTSLQLREFPRTYQKQIWEQMDRVHKRFDEVHAQKFIEDTLKYGSMGMVIRFIELDMKNNREINFQYIEMMYNGCLYLEYLHSKAQEN